MPVGPGDAGAQARRSPARRSAAIARSTRSCSPGRNHSTAPKSDGLGCARALVSGALRRLHATSPHARSSAVAWSTRSTASPVLAEPLGELGDAVLERDPGRVAEQLARARQMSAKQWRISPVRKLPVISGGRSGRPSAAASILGDLAHGLAAAAADVDHMAGCARRLEREAAGAGDVADVDEVAPLLAVLEHHRLRPLRRRAAKIASTPV